VARLLHREQLSLPAAIAVRIGLLVIVAVLFVNLIGPVSIWFGRTLAETFIH
jgi:hypothetical protein